MIFWASSQLGTPGSPLHPLLNLCVFSEGKILHASAVVALAVRTDQYLHLSWFFWKARLRDVGGGGRLCSQTLLLSSPCFHCCQEGSVIKLPFLCLRVWLYLQWAGCSPPAGGGGVWGRRCLWAHGRLFYTRLQEGQSQKINEETALLPQSLFLPARILWEESGYRGPQMGGSLTWQIEGWGRESGRDLAGGKCETCRCVFKTALSRILSSSQKRHHQSLHLYSHIFITRTAAKVSFQTLVGSTHALMSSVHELYKEPWGAALMFPFLRFLSMADITAWKYISWSHTGCEQRELLKTFFFWSVRSNLDVWDKSCRLFCTQSFTDSSAFLIVCQVFNEKLSRILCHFNLFGFVWAQIYPFLMCYFYKPRKEDPLWQI